MILLIKQQVTNTWYPLRRTNVQKVTTISKILVISMKRVINKADEMFALINKKKERQFVPYDLKKREKISKK
jgi:hypothetical protein